MGKSGKAGHNTSSGKNFKSRIKTLTKTYSGIGENCDYREDDDALAIVFSLLIDKDVSDLGHRKNILHPKFQFVGVSIQPHKKYNYNCVMDFGGGK